MKQRFLVLVLISLTTPPLAWLGLLWLSGLYDLSGIASLLIRPSSLSYLFLTFIFIPLWLYYRYRSLFSDHSNIDPEEMMNRHKLLCRLPKELLLFLILFCIIGPHFAMVGVVRDVKAYVLSYLLAFPVIMLCAIPYLIFLEQILADIGKDIPFMDDIHGVGISAKLFAVSLVISLGALFLLAIFIYIALLPGHGQLYSVSDNELLWKIGTVFFFIASISFIISYLLSQNIKNNLEKLVDTVRAISMDEEGGLRGQVDVISRDELGELSSKINSFLKELDQFIGSIVDDVHRIIGTAVKKGQPLARTKRLVKELVEVNRFKDIIEGDLDKEEIYNRLLILLQEKFEIKKGIFWEVDNSGRRMEPYQMEEMTDGQLCVCIRANSELCRAKRISRIIISTDFKGLCPFANLEEAEEHICFPMVMGGRVGGVVKIFGPQEEMSELHPEIPFIDQYIKITAPVVEAKRLIEVNRERSLKDELTGLFNRRFLEGYLEKEIPLIRRQEAIMAFLMVDIDFFKEVNDKYGHDVGDQVLQTVAQAIVRRVRSSDVVVRFGGEEFLVILPNVREGEGVRVGEKIRSEIESLNMPLTSGVLQKTVTVGVAEFPTDGKDAWQVIKYSDVALYEGKKQGRNRVVRFEQAMWMEDKY
jgi:diguanylate cyclase (GGDEF)-like protein